MPSVRSGVKWWELNSDSARAQMWDDLVSQINGGTGGLTMKSGQVTTQTAADTIATGLGTVAIAFAQLDDPPVLTCEYAQAQVGDQAGAPAAGAIVIKTWRPQSSASTTPTAASTFGKKVNWIAFGT